MQVQCPGDDLGTSVSQLSVAFLFEQFHQSNWQKFNHISCRFLQNQTDSGDLEAVSIFCSPEAIPRKYLATIDLNNNLVTSIVDKGAFVSNSNITTDGPAGKVFNGSVLSLYTIAAFFEC